MARVEFETFKEVSEFSRKLSIATRSVTTVHRDGNIWWVNDLRVETTWANVPAKVSRHIYLFDTSGSLVSVSEGSLTALPTQSSQGFAAQAETTTASSAQENRGSFKERLKHFQTYLNTQIIGQEAPIDSVCRRLRIAYSGLSHRDGPVAVFLFVGPSGVGKTELAKTVATYLMGGEQLLKSMKK